MLCILPQRWNWEDATELKPCLKQGCLRTDWGKKAVRKPEIIVVLNITLKPYRKFRQILYSPLVLNFPVSQQIQVFRYSALCHQVNLARQGALQRSGEGLSGGMGRGSLSPGPGGAAVHTCGQQAPCRKRSLDIIYISMHYAHPHSCSLQILSFYF